VSDYKQLLSFKVIRGSRIFPAASPEETTAATASASGKDEKGSVAFIGVRKLS